MAMLAPPPGPSSMSCITQIGETAGTIWQVLNARGPLTIAKLVKEIDAPRDVVMQGLGWLARRQGEHRRRSADSRRLSEGVSRCPSDQPQLPVESHVPEPLQSWLKQAVSAGASDLHLVAGHPPTLRVHGLLQRLNAPDVSDKPLSVAEVESALMPLLPNSASERFASDKNADFAFQLDTGTERSGSGPTIFKAAKASVLAFASFLPPFLLSSGRAFPSNWPTGWRIFATAWSCWRESPVREKRRPWR